MSSWQNRRPTRTPGVSAKEEILGRLRTALAVPRRDAVTEADDVPRTYQRADDRQEVSTDPAKVRAVLIDRLEDYTATVHRTTPEQAGETIARALEGARSIVVPGGLPTTWTEQLTATVTTDDGTASPRELDQVDAVLTGCHTAIALTGTLVLRADGRGGRRTITLIPDHHVVVVEADQVVLGVPKAIERMGEDPTAPWTLISGPSATSDIELSRVEGVHGPRRLDVVLIEPTPEPDPATEPKPGAEPKPAAKKPPAQKSTPHRPTAKEQDA